MKTDRRTCITDGLDAWLNFPTQRPAPARPSPPPAPTAARAQEPIEQGAPPQIPDWRAERDAARLTEQLLAAAMRAADHHGDSEAAREEWRQDVLDTPHHLRGDLLAHLEKTYPRRTP